MRLNSTICPSRLRRGCSTGGGGWSSLPGPTAQRARGRKEPRNGTHRVVPPGCSSNAPTPTELLGPSHTYRHAPARDAGYATLPRPERARLHVRLARWLEKTAGDDWPALAAAIGGHFDDALGETPSLADEVAEGLDRIRVAGLASVWLERAGQVAIDQAESDSARVLFQRPRSHTR